MLKRKPPASPLFPVPIPYNTRMTDSRHNASPADAPARGRIATALADARDILHAAFARRGRRAGTATAEPAFMRFSTSAGPLLVYTIAYGPAEDAVRVMEVDGAFQSATYVEDGREYDPVFDYFRAYDCLYDARDEAGNPPPFAHLLMLGGGGFAYPKHVVAHHAESAIDVVELDPTVIAVAERYFFLDRLQVEFDCETTGRLRIFTQDAVAFLHGETDESDKAGGLLCQIPRYDAILNDLFAGREPVAAFASEDGARLVHSRLAPGGLYLSNVISALTGEKAGTLEALAAVYARVFAHVWVLPIGAWAEDDRDNNLFIASDTAWTIPGAREL